MSEFNIKNKRINLKNKKEILVVSKFNIKNRF